MAPEVSQVTGETGGEVAKVRDRLETCGDLTSVRMSGVRSDRNGTAIVETDVSGVAEKKMAPRAESSETRAAFAKMEPSFPKPVAGAEH